MQFLLLSSVVELSAPSLVHKNRLLTLLSTSTILCFTNFCAYLLHLQSPKFLLFILIFLQVPELNIKIIYLRALLFFNKRMKILHAPRTLICVWSRSCLQTRSYLGHFQSSHTGCCQRFLFVIFRSTTSAAPWSRTSPGGATLAVCFPPLAPTTRVLSQACWSLRDSGESTDMSTLSKSSNLLPKFYLSTQRASDGFKTSAQLTPFSLNSRCLLD